MVAWQIAEEMNEPLVGTVQKWLQRERGYKKAEYKPEVIRRLKKGEPAKEIASAVGCSREYVRVLKHEIQDQLEPDESEVEGWVDQLIQDPEGTRNARFTRYESFGRALISRCIGATNEAPKTAAELIELAVDQFSYMRRLARKPARIQVLSCNLAQAMGVSAARERILGDARAALATLRSADIAGCVACEADFARRESIILRDLRRYPESLHLLESSRRLYRSMGHSGHDFRGNGLGSCALVESLTHYYMESPAVAVAVADKALRELVSPRDEALYFRLRFNRALALLEFDDRQKREDAALVARGLLEEVGSESSVPRMLTVFLVGRAAELTGDLVMALSQYEDALQDAETLEIPAAVSALLTDTARLSPGEDPGESFRHRAARLLTRDWVAPIADTLTLAARNSITEGYPALTRFRKDSGGDKLLPLSAAMART